MKWFQADEQNEKASKKINVVLYCFCVLKSQKLIIKP